MIQGKSSAVSDGALKEQICEEADEWYQAGINAIPMKATKAKAPVTKWTPWQTERIPESKHHTWFEKPKYHGLALVGGVSFNDRHPIELFEPETKEIGRELWTAAKKAGLKELLDRIAAGYMDESGGGGIHLLYRCEEVGTGVTLAATADGKTLIETKGRKHLIICAPTLGTVHEDAGSRGWRRLKGGPSTVATITIEEREQLFELARTFDQTPPPEVPKGSGRAGDEYNARGPEIEELIEAAGWMLVRRDGESSYWKRPDGTRESASLGWVRDSDGDPMLHVFTSSAAPFEVDKNYSKFAVYTALTQGGLKAEHFKAAAKVLRAEGYGKAGRGGGSGGETKSDILLAIVNDNYDLGQTPGGDHYAVAKEGQGPYVARMIGKKGGGQFRAEIAARYAAKEDSAPDDQTIRNVLLVARGRAMNSEPVELGLRVARYGDGSVVDMGEPRTGRAIVIQPDGWEVVDRSPVLFRRTKLTQALPEPVRGGRLIRPLRKFVHLADNPKFPLLVACEVFILLRPDEPAPVPYFSGEAGAVKTGATRAYARLVDPAYPQTRRRPTNEKDWLIAARGSRVVALDNLYGIQDWLQGSICRAVTGEGDVSRELYSDDELVVMSYRRALTFNGIDITNMRDDLADRVINFEIPMMNPRKRLKDREATDAFEDDWPEMLGGLLDLAVKVLRALPKVEKPVDGWSRMADFEEVLLAVDRVLRTNGFAAYRQARKSLAEDVIEDRTFTSLLRRLVDRSASGSVEMTCTALLDALTNNLADSLKPPKGWPETGRAVSAVLKSAAPSFRKLGYEVEYLGAVGPNRDRTWRVARSGDPHKVAEEQPRESPFDDEPSINEPKLSSDGDEVSFDVGDVKPNARGRRKRDGEVTELQRRLGITKG